MSNVYRNLRGDRNVYYQSSIPAVLLVVGIWRREVSAEYLVLCWVLRTWGGECGWE